jgi:hypothetical protein
MTQLADGLLQLKKEPGSGLGAVLKVVHEGKGIARRGIDITVAPGQPPIAVNSTAGKAFNLDADELDIALSAGGIAVDIEDHLNGIVPFRSSYQIEFQDNGAPSKFSANIVCMDLGKAHA